MAAPPIGTVFGLDPALFDMADAHVTPDVAESLTRDALQALDLAHEEAPASGGTTCLACGINAFPGGAEEQRRHFKTDWHRLNVKRRLAGHDPLTEDQFDALIDQDREDEVGSLSGSDSGSEDDASDDEGDEDAGTAAVGPQFMFSGTDGQPQAVWRCLLAPDRQRSVDPPPPAECLAALRRLVTAGGRWAVILFSGGHFAAAIFDVKPPKSASASAASQKYTAAAADAALTELHHRSFHKYVVRAKAGGKQSTKDATGKYARSAGSRLRRHNEAALERDVRDTLLEWKDALAECSLVLVAAPGSNGRTLFAGDEPMLDRQDSKIRKIPFVTRRPTLSEAKRVARVLLTVYDAAAAAAAREAAVRETREREAAAARAAEERERQEKAQAERARAREEAAGLTSAAAAVAAAEQAEKEEAAKAKKAEKRAKAKQRQKEQRQAEAAEAAAARAAAAAAAAENEIGRAARQAAALAQRAAAQAAAPKPTAQASAPPRLSAKALAAEDAATRRARMAAAAEARAKALQAASAQQRLY